MTTFTDSFRLAEPQLCGALAVFPVLGGEPLLEYRAFHEAIALGALVKELDDGASVRELIVENPTDRAVLVFEGEEVIGAQQNRTFDVSVLVAEGGAVRVPVSCVEAGRWDGRRHHEHLAPAPQAAYPRLRGMKRSGANRSLAAGMAAVPAQSAVWSEVSERLAEHEVASPTGAMADVYDARRGELEAITGAVSPLQGQVGSVATISGRPVALDLVSRPDVFAALLSRLAQGYALDALGASEAAEPGARAAEGFLHAALEAPRWPAPTPGMGAGFAVSANGLDGAGIEHRGELVALSAFPAQVARAEDAAPVARGIARPSRRRSRRAG